MADTKDVEYHMGSLMLDEKEEKMPGNIKKRETWGRAFDFLIACIGGSIGLGNMWRFPYLCYKNGGGAFLIPYFICMLFGSLPLFILEVALGQYSSGGGMQAWSILPLFQGLGLAVTVTVFYVNCYYNMVLAWGFFYLFHSFSSTLPWDSCDGEWNTEHCTTDFASKNVTNITSLHSYNNSTIDGNVTFTGDAAANVSSHMVDSVTEFWEKKVLGLSSGIEEMGVPKWDIALCLLLAWVTVYLCICKGIKSSGKVMYFTAPAPYVFMIIILIRNATLPGAVDGVNFYISPNLTRLTDLSVWTDAGKQTFYSSSVCQGIAITVGSYNKFKHNSCRDSVIFAFVNAFTSFFAGFLVFTILGFMAFQQGRPIAEVAESGPGLVFIAYPKAVAQMPLAQFWSVAFFIMILLLGLDSQFLSVEAVVTAVMDQFPHVLRQGRRKEFCIGMLCLAMFIIGLLFSFNGGMYVFQLFDFYCGGRVLIMIGFLEVIAISYCYGIRRFRDNMEMMVGATWLRWLFPYLAICWCFLTPLLCGLLFIMSALNYKELSYSRPNESIYLYPAWAEGIGWVLAMSSLVVIPAVAMYRFIKYGFTVEVFKRMLVPLKLKPHQMRPQDKLERTLYHLDEDINTMHS